MPRLLAYALSGLMFLAPFAVAWKYRDNQSISLALALLVSATVTAAPLVEHHYMILLLLPIWALLCAFLHQKDILGVCLLAATFSLLSQPYRLARVFLAVVPASWDSEILGEAVLTTGAVALYLLLLTVVVKRAIRLRQS